MRLFIQFSNTDWFSDFRVWEAWDACPSGGFKNPLYADDSHIYSSSPTSGLKSACPKLNF